MSALLPAIPPATGIAFDGDPITSGARPRWLAISSAARQARLRCRPAALRRLHRRPGAKAGRPSAPSPHRRARRRERRSQSQKPSARRSPTPRCRLTFARDTVLSPSRSAPIRAAVAAGRRHRTRVSRNGRIPRPGMRGIPWSTGGVSVRGIPSRRCSGHGGEAGVYRAAASPVTPDGDQVCCGHQDPR